MTETFNVELAKIHKWLQVNKLSKENIDKTNYILFRSKKKHKAPKLNIAIDGKISEMVNQTEVLGVLMDDFFTWKAHINHVANIVAKWLGKKYFATLFISSSKNSCEGDKPYSPSKSIIQTILPPLPTPFSPLPICWWK